MCWGGGGELRRAERGSWGESHHWFEGQYYLLLMPSGCENVALVMGLKPSNPDSRWQVLTVLMSSLDDPAELLLAAK